MLHLILDSDDLAMVLQAAEARVDEVVSWQPAATSSISGCRRASRIAALD
jgi:hypothetical protein